MPKLPKSDKPTMADLRRDPARYTAELAQLLEIAQEFSANMMRAVDNFQQVMDRVVERGHDDDGV